MSSPDSPRSRRRIVIWLGLAAALLLAAGAGAYVLLSRRRRLQPECRVPRRADGDSRPGARQEERGRLVGRCTATRPSAATTCRPRKRCARRSRRLWSWNAHSLLEFTPVIGERQAVLIKNSGAVYAIAKRTGRPVWGRDMGTLAASRARLRRRAHLRDDPQARPQVARGAASPSLRAKDGKMIWSQPLPSRTETSPLLANGHVYVGSEDGTVYALRASDGGVRLALPGVGRGQGRARARRRQALLRRLRRPRHTRSARATASACGR